MAESVIHGNTDSGWKQLTATNRDIWYRKKNGIVYLTISSYGGSSAVGTSWTVLGNLPSEYRPSRQIVSSGAGRFGASLEVHVETDGNISAISNVANTTVFGVSVSFPTN